ncbi:polysaccharide biosynthesis tyrosine autokinase [Rudaeicoccus suwonensis]|uniref:Capsular exopolysaccharide synthesis family protein n=1 Tax=Rudaeicoccus suwonensis TaxID=657409 RepID=A0A561E8R3_9MICO|nr:polysaccharide biosynthesis tyrosine autokinase [Rudaeicoccus suwonensis]TWE12005.1 capsular exopolysaccharide synthesis family protein [Rudaeicoccus suwonensis]
MTVTDFVRFSRTNALLLLLFTIVGGALMFGYTFTKPTLYSATAQGLVSAGGADNTGSALNGVSLAQTKAQEYAALASSAPVAERAAQALGPNAPGGSISASVSAVSSVINFTAISSTPNGARELADAAVNATRDEAAQIETTGEPAGTQPSVRIYPFDNATTPSLPFSPDFKKATAEGLLAGLVAGYLWAAFRRQLDSRVRHQDDVERHLEAPVVGVIPKVPELAEDYRGDTGLGNAAEALRMLRTNLRFIDVDRHPRSIVVTSPNPGEGKSTVAANLARVLAAAGQPVVLIDADLRKPMVATIFNLEGSIGLTQALAGDITLHDVMQPTTTPDLVVIPAGRIPPNPSELVGSRRMETAITELSKDHLVIIDAPPLLPVTDAGLLARSADGALLVMHVGRTRAEHIRLCARILTQVGGRLFGGVMNLTPPKNMGSAVYGYGYSGKKYNGYGYGYGDSPAPTPAQPSPPATPAAPTATMGTQPATAGDNITDQELGLSRRDRRSKQGK